MKNWLTRNAVWLGSLGAIAGIIGLAWSLFPQLQKTGQSQNAVVTGNNSKVIQTQPDSSDESQSQNSIVEGDGSSVFQKQ